jgi:PPOX class probable F420-dependent enzyme
MISLSPEGLQFVTERYLATLTTLRRDGTPHVTPVGFTWDATAGLARVICSGSSQKARNVGAGGPVSICQLDGPRWLTLEGIARVHREPDAVAEAVARYAARYRPPRQNPARVAIVVEVTRALGSPALLA